MRNIQVTGLWPQWLISFGGGGFMRVVSAYIYIYIYIIRFLVISY